MSKILFPGSFDPFTRGHESIVSRALKMFDEVVVAVGYNPDKQGMLTPFGRVELIKTVFRDEPRVKVEMYEGLTVDFAHSIGADAILRGVRNTLDFESERDLADINRELGEVETIVMYALPEYGALSSSMVRQLIQFGKNPAEYLPTNVTYEILKQLSL